MYRTALQIAKALLHIAVLTAVLLVVLFLTVLFNDAFRVLTR